MANEVPGALGASTSAILVSTLGNILIGVYRDTPDAASLRALGAEHLRLTNRHPKGVGVLSFCATGVRLPDAEARAVMGELARVNKALTLATAIVIPGTGFWPSAARSVIDGATRAFGSARSPQSTFDSMDPAAAWLIETMGVRTTSASTLARTARDLARSAGLDDLGQRIGVPSPA